MKKLEDYSFNELTEWATQTLHSALLRDGGIGMKAEMYTIYNCFTEWHELNKNKKKKK